MIEEIKIAIYALESGMVENIVDEAISTHQSLISSGSNNSIKTSLTDWKDKIKNQLKSKPFDEDIEKEIDYCQQVKHYNQEFFNENIEAIIIKIGEGSCFYEQANKLVNEQALKPNPLFQHHFCEQWYQLLLSNLKEDRLNNIEKEKLLADLYQRSETISKLNEIEGDIDEEKNLRLWDMARSKLSKIDITQLSKITQFLQQNNELHKMAKKLGRMATQVEKSSLTDIEIEKITKVETQTTCVAGNIIGIHNSNDLERLLATESM